MPTSGAVDAAAAAAIGRRIRDVIGDVGKSAVDHACCRQLSIIHRSSRRSGEIAEEKRKCRRGAGDPPWSVICPPPQPAGHLSCGENGAL